MPLKETIIFHLLNKLFDTTTLFYIENGYIPRVKNISQWMCFSDYCLDDKNKPNDVITFTLMPYIVDFEVMGNFINTVAKTDIKNTSKINPAFMRLIKDFPFINFSFIVNNRKNFYGDTHKEVRENLMKDYTSLHDMYQTWITNEPHKKAEYIKLQKKVKRCIVLVKENHKIKQLIDINLISSLGAYVCAIILDRIEKLDKFAWLSDRDSLFDIEEGLVINFFHNSLSGLLKDPNFKFYSTLANSKFEIFYDNMIRIPDHIAGTLADYNGEANLISHAKFDTVLTEYMGDNIYNNYIFILHQKNNQFYTGKATITSKKPEL